MFQDETNQPESASEPVPVVQNDSQSEHRSVVDDDLVMGEPADYSVEHVEYHDEPASVTVPADGPKEPPLNTTNFTITNNPISPTPTGRFDPSMKSLTGPPNNYDATREAISQAPRIDSESSADNRRWTAILNSGMYFTPAFSQYANPLADPSVHWRQSLKSPAGNLAAGVPQYGDAKGESVSGTRALMRVRSQIGLGTYLNIPCYHSGFWITLRAPMRSEIDELFRAIESNKRVVCNDSYGLALSNSTSYMLRPILDLIVNNLHDTSVKNASFDWVMSRLSSLDVPWVIAHLAHLVWRRGFQYVHSCINDIQTCSSVITELIEIGKCAWVASERLTDRQIAHMTKRSPSSMTLDEVDAYRNGFVWTYGEMVEIKGEGDAAVKFFIKDPSCDDYVNAGTRWVQRLEESISKTTSQHDDPEERNAALLRSANLTDMMEYSHWVSYIDLGEGQKITEPGSIDLVLADLSGDRILVESFNQAIKTFIDKSTVAIIAAPTTKCPVCQQEDIERGELFKGLVAMDVINTFFTLLSQEITGEMIFRRRPQ